MARQEEKSGRTSASYAQASASLPPNNNNSQPADVLPQEFPDFFCGRYEEQCMKSYQKIVAARTFLEQSKEP